MIPSAAAAVALGASVWVALLIAAPALPVAAAGLMYAAGSLICHQLPERSFHLDVYQLPVCARCFGLYAGCAIGSVIAVAASWAGPVFMGSAGEARHSARTVALAATLAAAVPTAMTFALEWGGGWPISNAVRAVAAVPFGAAVGCVVGSALATVHYGECAPRRPLDHGQPPRTSI